jgi:hypothetical protein
LANITTFFGVKGYNTVPINKNIRDCQFIMVYGPVAVDTKTEVIYPDLHICPGCDNCVNCLVPVYCSTCEQPLSRRRALVRFQIEYRGWLECRQECPCTSGMSCYYEVYKFYCCVWWDYWHFKDAFVYEETYPAIGNYPITLSNTIHTHTCEFSSCNLNRLYKTNAISVIDDKESIQMVCEKYELQINQEYECYIQVVTDKITNPTVVVDLGDGRPTFELTSAHQVWFGEPITPTIDYPTVFAVDYAVLNCEILLQYGIVKKIELFAIDAGTMVVDVSSQLNIF